MNNDGLSLQPGHRCGCDLNAMLSWIVSIARMLSAGSRSLAAIGGARFQWRSPAGCWSRCWERGAHCGSWTGGDEFVQQW